MASPGGANVTTLAMLIRVRTLSIPVELASTESELARPLVSPEGWKEYLPLAEQLACAQRFHEGCHASSWFANLSAGNWWLVQLARRRVHRTKMSTVSIINLNVVVCVIPVVVALF